MAKERYAVGLVGYGGMGGWHSNILNDFDRIYLKGVYDIAPERLVAASDKGYVAYKSFDELLSDSDIDIVLVATPNDFHRDYVIRALDAGKNAISEKPVTLGSEDLQMMIDAANRSGKLFTVHQNRRWDADFRIMKKIYDDHALGDVFNIETRVHGSRGIPGDWRGKAVHGGGMMLDWGVHILDQLLMMVNEKIKTVYTEMFHVTNYEVDDGFKMLVTFESGLRAQIEVGTSNFINLPRWYMLGENGSAVIEDFSCRGRIVKVTNWDKKDAVPVVTAAGLTKTMAPRTNETINEVPLPHVDTDIHDFYRNIIGVLDGKETQIVKHDELMRVMRLMEAAFRSSKLGQAVTFE